jgi:amidase
MLTPPVSSGRSVEDAAIVLDIIQKRSSTSDSDNEPLISAPLSGRHHGPYTSWLSDKNALKAARFGLPWKRVWQIASEDVEKKLQYNSLTDLIKKIEEADATIVTSDFPSAEEIISPDGWDWTFGEGTTGSALSEFEVVRTEFYRSLQSYLSELVENPNKIYSLEDVIAYNVQHTAQEGGIPGTHPAWPTGQDYFDKCIESKDWPEERYVKALEYIRRKSREEGIDAALICEGGNLDGLLVPLQADRGVAWSVAAKAGYPMISIPVGIDGEGIPFGVGIIQSAWNEHLLVKYGSAIEDLARGRTLPTFMNFDAQNHPYIGTPPDKAQEI